jgi:hypothetical protein
MADTTPRRLPPEKTEDLAEGELETVEESLQEHERKEREQGAGAKGSSKS